MNAEDMNSDSGVLSLSPTGQAFSQPSAAITGSARIAMLGRPESVFGHDWTRYAAVMPSNQSVWSVLIR